MTILQPGSTVATALSEGEAKKKHVFVLEVLKNSFRTIKQELLTVRPFKFEQVTVSKHNLHHLVSPHGKAAEQLVETKHYTWVCVDRTLLLLRNFVLALKNDTLYVCWQLSVASLRR